MLLGAEAGAQHRTLLKNVSCSWLHVVCLYEEILCLDSSEAGSRLSSYACCLTLPLQALYTDFEADGGCVTACVCLYVLCAFRVLPAPPITCRYADLKI